MKNIAPGATSRSLSKAAWLTAGALARLIDVLDRDGEEARVVGGGVRNALIDMPLHEIDVATTAIPEEVVRRVQAAGFKVPQDIACACLSIREGSDHLTGVRPNYFMIGVKAISQLATQIRVGERGVPEFPPQTYVQSEWQEGNTAPQRN